MQSFSLAVTSNPDGTELESELTSASVLASLPVGEDTPVRDVLAAADTDYTVLVEQLYGRGYYSADVRININGQEAALIDPFSPPARIDAVRVMVDPGPLFTFGRTRIGPLPNGFEAPPEFMVGQVADADVVRAVVTDAINAWRDIGYAKAQVTSQSVIADHARDELLVDVTISQGVRATIGEAQVTGSTKVREDRVIKIAGLPVGARYSPEDTEQAAERLRRTGTFQSVRVLEDDTIAPDGTLGFTLNVVDRKPRRFGGGAEYTNVDGITLSGYWLHRNFLGGAERFRVEGQIAQIGATGSGADYDLSARLEKPAVLGADTRLFAEARLSYSDEPDYLVKKVELGSGFTRQFTNRLSGSLGVGLSYSQVTDRFATPNTTRAIQLATLPSSLTYDRRNDTLDATRGYYLSGTYTPFYDTIYGQAGHHMTFDARGYYSLDESSKYVAAARLQGGWLQGPDAQDAPPEFLFYSGGGGTVRGQPYQSLGANYGTYSLGGRAFAAVSGEMRIGVTDNIGVVALADAGFVGPDDFSAGAWHAGAGIGLRYKTPVGPIRLDVAAPIAGTTGAGVQVYIGIGQAF